MEIPGGTIEENELWGDIIARTKAYDPGSPSLWLEAVENVFTDKKEMYELVDRLRSMGYNTGFLSNTEIPAME